MDTDSMKKNSSAGQSFVGKMDLQPAKAIPFPAH